MNKISPTNRVLKEKVGQWLSRGPLEQIPPDLAGQSARRLINPLLSFLYNREALLKWHAVTIIGQVVAELADNELESARVIMRRLMWSLNDESGGIGWGAPETMGEIMARHRRLADEFHPILISYLDPGGNYLEHEALQPGALWGLGRLAGKRKELAAEAAPLLPPYLVSLDPEIRGHAAWAAMALDSESLKPVLNRFVEDKTVFCLYRDQRLEQVSIKDVINNLFRR